MLKHFISKLPHLKVVVIPISYFTLEYSALDSPEKWRDYYTFHFLGASEANWWQIVSNSKYLSLFCLYGPEKIREILKSKFTISYANDTDTSGWYSGNYGSLINIKSAAERVLVIEECMKSKYIEINRERLKELLSLCKSHIVKVVFITTPVHYLYYQQIDKNRWLKTQEIISQLIENFNAVYFYYSQDEHFKPSDFRDNDHLNKR